MCGSAGKIVKVGQTGWKLCFVPLQHPNGLFLLKLLGYLYNKFKPDYFMPVHAIVCNGFNPNTDTVPSLFFLPTGLKVIPPCCPIPKQPLTNLFL